MVYYLPARPQCYLTYRLDTGEIGVVLTPENHV
jgi:hypothetical protein